MQLAQPFRLRWSSRATIGLFLALSAGVLTAIFFAVNYFSAIIETNIQGELKILAIAKRELIENFLQERRQDVELLSRRPAVWQSLQSGGRPVGNLAEIVRDTAEIYKYRDVRIVDSALRTIISTSNAPLSQEETSRFKEALNTGTPRLIEHHFDTTNRRVFGYVSPIHAAGRPMNAVIGLAYVELDLENNLNHILEQMPSMLAGLEIVVVSYSANDVVYLNHLRFTEENKQHLLRRPLKTPELAATKLRGVNEPTSVSAIDYRGVAVEAAGVPVRGTPWMVIVETDRAEISGPILNLRLATGITIFVFILLTGAGVRNFLRMRQSEFELQRSALAAQGFAARRASIDGYLAAAEDGSILEANDATCAISGYSRAELCAMNLTDLVSNETKEEVRRGFASLPRTGPVRLQTQWRHKQGQLLEIDVSAEFVSDGTRGFFYSFVRDMTVEINRRRQLERLNALYRFLSQVNAAVSQHRTIDDVLKQVCESAIKEAGFTLAWVGRLNATGDRVVPEYAAGPGKEYAESVVITTDPTLATSQGPAGRCIETQEVQISNDFLNEPRTEPWHKLAEKHKLAAGAALPLVVSGKSIGIMNFYASTPDYFDQQLNELIKEIARTVSMAIESAQLEKDKATAEAQRETSENRLSRIFEASPIPIQIHSIKTRRIHSVNRAHVSTFGHRPDEFPDEAAWFAAAYPDEVLRAQIAMIWDESIATLQKSAAGTIVESPEIGVRCKDGTVRPARAFATLSGDDVIVQWLDLTEIRRAEKDLIENEKHFRSMVEQTLFGVSVMQDNVFVYANAQFCKIVEQPLERILGQDSLTFYGQTEETRARVLACRNALLAGEPRVSLQVPFTTGAQQNIVLGLHGSMGTWNGKPAILTMSEDITENKNTEGKIAAYVAQLEGAMEGTLQAVAKMVDLRDPYTAGHERRVGIIAADIARELGWPEERAHSLQLIGLVHDIGKIGVPAEILSKPTRLTAPEFDMIKTHAERGYEILRDVHFTVPIAEIIRQHHERLNGSGYPRGLSGEQILPEARVLAVADVLESMATHRPYRPALGVDAALKELDENRNSLFDGEVVDAALRLIREKSYRLPD